VASTFAFLERKCCFSLIYPVKQVLADPRPGPFATRTPSAWMHSSTGRGRDCESFDSEVLADKVTSVYRRDLRSAGQKDAG
jgi:hypothetical protein